MSGQPVIHIVDDDAALRKSLSFLLTSADYSVRAYESALALLERVDELEAGCIVTDIRMPAMTGLELARELKQRGVALPVIVLTGHAEISLAVAAMKAGAVDFLEKPFQDKALLAAIGAALAQAASEAEALDEAAAIKRRASALTPRERDVFNAVVAGDSNKEAALRLGISPRTVEIYRANAMEKMGARTLSDLVRMALRGELI
jgi:two-component system, LuxR family, response regulator FixJ